MEKRIIMELVEELKIWAKSALDDENYGAAGRYTRILDSLKNDLESEPHAADKGSSRVHKENPAVAREATPRGRPRRKTGPRLNYDSGTVLTTKYKERDYRITAKDKGYDLEGQYYSTLSKVVDAFAGDGKAKHLRYLKRWKAV